MAVAAAMQVNRMRYNFMIKLKNNVSIIAMEGGWNLTLSNPVLYWSDAVHSNVTAWQFLREFPIVDE